MRHPRTEVRPAATLRYADGPEQVADLWLPAGTGPHPLVVSVHGGYFQAAYGRDLHDPMARALVSSGLGVLNVEYRRADVGGSFDETTADVVAALSLVDQVPEVDARLGCTAVGHSAGGYLALWLALDPRVTHVVALAAASDLAGCVRGGYDGGAVARWLGAGPDGRPDLYRRTDLVDRLPTGSTTLLVHGTADPLVPYAQSVRYADAARLAGEDVRLETVEGGGHFEVIEPTEAAFERWRAQVVAWSGLPV